MGTIRNLYRKLIGALITRPIQRFNVENRAERVLDSDRLRPAPKFEADAKLLERLKQGNLLKDDALASNRSITNN
jgi:hypothetical protein